MRLQPLVCKVTDCGGVLPESSTTRIRVLYELWMSLYVCSKCERVHESDGSLVWTSAADLPRQAVFWNGIEHQLRPES